MPAAVVARRRDPGRHDGVAERVRQDRVQLALRRVGDRPPPERVAALQGDAAELQRPPRRVGRSGEQPDRQVSVGGVEVRRDGRPGAGWQAAAGDAGEHLAQLHGGVGVGQRAARTLVAGVTDHRNDQRELTALAGAGEEPLRLVGSVR